MSTFALSGLILLTRPTVPLDVSKLLDSLAVEYPVTSEDREQILDAVNAMHEAGNVIEAVLRDITGIEATKLLAAIDAQK